MSLNVTSAMSSKIFLSIARIQFVEETKRVDRLARVLVVSAFLSHRYLVCPLGRDKLTMSDCVGDAHRFREV